MITPATARNCPTVDILRRATFHRQAVYFEVGPRWAPFGVPNNLEFHEVNGEQFLHFRLEPSPSEPGSRREPYYIWYSLNFRRAALCHHDHAGLLPWFLWTMGIYRETDGERLYWTCQVDREKSRSALKTALFLCTEFRALAEESHQPLDGFLELLTTYGDHPPWHQDAWSIISDARDFSEHLTYNHIRMLLNYEMGLAGQAQALIPPLPAGIEHSPFPRPVLMSNGTWHDCARAYHTALSRHLEKQ
jgi:hypothetical protein